MGIDSIDVSDDPNIQSVENPTNMWVLVSVQNTWRWTWDVQHPVNNGINYQPQLVQDFFHHQSNLFWLLSGHRTLVLTCCEGVPGRTSVHYAWTDGCLTSSRTYPKRFWRRFFWKSILILKEPIATGNTISKQARIFFKDTVGALILAEKFSYASPLQEKFHHFGGTQTPNLFPFWDETSIIVEQFLLWFSSISLNLQWLPKLFVSEIDEIAFMLFSLSVVINLFLKCLGLGWYVFKKTVTT